MFGRGGRDGSLGDVRGYALQLRQGLAEEHLVALTEVVDPIAPRPGRDVMLGASAIAELDELAVLARRRRGRLQSGEVVNQGPSDQFLQRRFHDVADEPALGHEMVAGVQVAAEFQHVGVGAPPAVAAQCRAAVDDLVKAVVYETLGHLADVAIGPYLEDIEHEAAELLSRATEVRRLAARRQLHDRDELKVADPAVDEIAVDVAGVGGVGAVERRQDVELHAVLPEQLQAGPCAVKCRPAGLVAPK